MERLKPFVAAAIAAAAVLLLGACHALDRGDVGSHIDDELAFSRIGFLMTDGGNSALLYRNAVEDIKGDDTFIEITIPYFVDQAGTTPLVPMAGSELTLTFETVAKDARVYHSSNLTTPIEPGLNPYAFHDGTYPTTESFVIRKTDPSTGTDSERWFYVSVRKDFFPVVELLPNPAFTAPPDYPATIAVHFEDELGNTVPLGSPLDGFTGSLDQIWLDDGDGIGEDPAKKDITADFSSWFTNAAYPEAGLAAARPLVQGNFRLTVPENTADFYFIDQNGFQNGLKTRTFTASWDPDAVYMAEWGSVGAAGTKTDPVRDLAEALSLTGSAFSRWEIRVAEGDYDLGAGVVIAENVSLYGGYRNDFSSRYDMEDADTRTAHGSHFYGVPALGGGVNDINGVLTYDPGAATINDSSILDGFVITAATQDDGGENWTTALEITNDASPVIRYCTLAGGGGAARQGISGATLTSCTGTPEFRWSVILAAQTPTNGANAGIYGFDTMTYLIASGNHIRGARSLSDASFGIRLVGGANALLHYNDIASAQAYSESIGISAVSSGYLVYNANLVASGSAAVGQSCGLSFGMIGGTAYVYKNTIRSGDGSISTGIETVNVGIENYEIANNAIHVGNGTTESRGLYIDAFGTPAALRFANNLVDSSNSGLLGYSSAMDISNDPNCPLENNAFDDADGTVDMIIDGVTLVDLRTAQDGSTNLFGNIAKTFAFDANGRLSSGLDANLAYGGQDGSVYSAEAANFNAYDWNDYYRSQDFGSCGWSIGPYEFDSVAYPAAVHVSTDASNPGSDKYVLGTAAYPFEFIDTAYTEIAARPVWPKYLRVAQGTHAVNAAITMNTDMTITGGWNPTFTNRSNTPYSTIIEGTDATIFDIDGVSSAFVMEGLTFQSTHAANSTMIIIENWANPVFRYNTLDGTLASPATSYLLEVDSYSSPDVHHNTFIGGNPAGSDVGIHTIAFAHPNIHDNTLTGGAPTGGASIGILSDNYAYPNIYDNVITGGSPIAGDTLCLRLINCGFATVRDNEINGGTPGSGASVMMEISGSGSTPNVYGNDLDGPSITGAVTGIAVLSDADPTITNNAVFSGDSGSNVFGIIVQGAGTSPMLQGNTVVAGDPGAGNASTTIAVTSDASPTIGGNILVGGPGQDSAVIDIDSTVGTTVDGNTLTLGTADYVYGITAANGPHTMTNNVIGGGTAANTLTGIFVSSAAGTNMTGNTITLGAGDSTVGITVENTAGFTIDNADIAGGSAVTSLYGIRLSNTSSGTVLYSDIDIAGNAGLPVSFGLYSLTGPGLVVDNNSIAGGAGITAYGVYLMGGTVMYVTDNSIAGTAAGTTTTNTSTGLLLSGTAQTTVRRNAIHAGEASDTARGIDVVTPNITCITNNLVHGGGLVTSTATGIRLADGDNVSVLFNNTVYAGRSSGGRTLGVHLAGTAQPRMANNLIIAGAGVPVSECIGIMQESASIPPLFLTNIIVGTNPATVAYRDDAGTDWTTADEIQAHFVANLGGPPNHVITPMADTGANLTDEHPSVYLRDFTANGGISEFFADDWRLSGGGQQDAPAGGSDLSGYGAPYGITEDHNGTTRTVPWSIGAYEY